MKTILNAHILFNVTKICRARESCNLSTCWTGGNARTFIHVYTVLSLTWQNCPHLILLGLPVCFHLVQPVIRRNKNKKQKHYTLRTCHCLSPEFETLLCILCLHPPLSFCAQCGIVTISDFWNASPDGPQTTTGLSSVCWPSRRGLSVVSLLTAMYRSSEIPLGNAPSGINRLIPTLEQIKREKHSIWDQICNLPVTKVIVSPKTISLDCSSLVK